MSRPKWKITPEMLARAHDMRSRKKTWYVIARTLGVHEETIRRAVDAAYDARRAAMYAKRTERRRVARPPRLPRNSRPRETKYREASDLRFDTPDAVIARRATLASNAAFVAAMTAAHGRD